MNEKRAYTGWSNQVRICGRVGNTPARRVGKTGLSQVFFDMVWSALRDDKRVCWFTVSAFEALGERILLGARLGEEIFHPVYKGDVVEVEGRLFSHKKPIPNSTYTYNAVLINAVTLRHVKLGSLHGRQDQVPRQDAAPTDDASDWIDNF